MIKNIHSKILALILICISINTKATTLLSPTINNGGFESGSTGWSFVNSAGTSDDKWFVGTATSFAGTQSAYVSNNSGATNTYTGTTSRIQHIYRSITFPVGEPTITLSFKWKTDGEGSSIDWDNLKVFVSTTTPTVGTANAAVSQVGSAWYNFSTTWQTATITLPASLAGTTSKLIFQWKCDVSGAYDPPAAIDDITLITDTTTVVTGTGCTSNTSLFPSSTFTPTCSGSQETITSAGYATEYSMVNVVSGTSYTFSTDISTDYLTIANSSGGTPIYAAGTTPVTWVATFTGAVRVYNNTNSLCGTNTSIRYRYVQCGTPPTPPSNDNCVNATLFPTVPTDGSCSTLSNQTTLGATNSSVTPSGACTSNAGTPDDDVWFKFIATANTIILNATWVSGATDVYWQVFSSSCNSTMTSILCTDNNNSAIMPGLTIGQTYFIRLYTYGSSTSTVQNLCLQTPPANDNCINAIAFPTIPADGTCATLSNQTTIGTTNSNVTPTGACTSNYGTPDDDIWFSFVATASDLTLTGTWVSGETDIYWQVFSSACGSTMTSILCTDNNSGGIMSGLTIGQTYYIKMYTYYSSYTTTQNICISNPCPNGTPNNDLPCNAINIPLGSIASGDNNCAFSSGEPTTPSCWTSGVRNTVWYSFVAASTSAKIRTAPGTLKETQIAVYSGTCGSAMTSINCNNNAPDCGYTTLDISESTLSGLTVGNTYYIAVDGEYDEIGTFAITVVNGTSSYPATSGQECVTPITVCNSTISVGDPGYQGIGFTCDQNNTDTDGPNCTTGERGAAWYKIIIDNPGTLYFNIIPNDYNPSGFTGDETDYDFLLWKINGSGATTCSAINTNGGANTVACNFNYLGVTGLYTSGNAPATYGSGFDAAYEPGITVAAGDIYLLSVQNYSNSTSGFTLDFTNTAAGVVNYGIPTSVTWSGGANTTSWTTIANWGGCTIPTCGINAIISPSSAFQPQITAAMGTVDVRNLTIDPGATLNLGPNATIKICESLFNNGTIIADPTSTILFSDDNTLHSLNGTLTGSSSLGNLLITDITGSTNCTVICNTNLDLKGNLTTSNINSIFNLNNKNLTINGNILNAAGATTFTNIPNSTITFAGNLAQIYSPNQTTATPKLTLNNVVMNHTGSGVTISTTNTPNMELGTSGTLTLTQGKIITPNSQEVILNNTSTTAVSSGNTNSYIEGNLRRYLAANAVGSFDFPVGHATPGYERANLNFTSPAAALPINLLARFDTWNGTWPLPAAPGWTECGVTYNAPYLDNGYWSIDASSATTGNYTTTLYNRSYTNAQSAWSIAKSPSSSPSWALNGTCTLATPVTAVQRTSMSGFSKFATVQYSITLPVELVSFTGTMQTDGVLLKWITTSEKNSDYYLVEKSTDGINFITIGTVLGAGNSNTILHYSLLDEQPFVGENYYRLKQVDIDGTYAYSSIIQINYKIEKIYIDNIHPNPANENLYFDFYTTQVDKLRIKLYDYLGRIIIDNTKTMNIGKNSITMNIADLAKGIYMLKINSTKSDYTFTKKIIKE